MSDYRQQARDLADAAERQVLALYAAWQAGRITRDELRDLAAEVIAGYDDRAAGAADVALAAALTLAAGSYTAPLGIVPPDQTARLVQAITTLLDRAQPESVDTEAMLRRLARSEPLATAQDTFSVGMQRQKVPGWVRQTDSSPCPLCRRLADGIVRPPSVQMKHHPGCGCTQRVVLT